MTYYFQDVNGQEFAQDRDGVPQCAEEQGAA
jgi:hypothetical protein